MGLKIVSSPLFRVIVFSSISQRDAMPQNQVHTAVPVLRVDDTKEIMRQKRRLKVKATALPTAGQLQIAVLF